MTSDEPLQLITVSGKKSVENFATVESRFDDGWPASAVRSYRGSLVLGGRPGTSGLDWAGSAAFRRLVDLHWTIVDLVRGEDPAFFTALGRRLIAGHGVRRVGLLLPVDHPGVAALVALDFTAVGHAVPPDSMPQPAHLLPKPGEVRLVWNAAFPHKSQQ